MGPAEVPKAHPPRQGLSAILWAGPATGDPQGSTQVPNLQVPPLLLCPGRPVAPSPGEELWERSLGGPVPLPLSQKSPETCAREGLKADG